MVKSFYSKKTESSYLLSNEKCSAMKSEKDLSDYRKVYQKSELLETNIPDNPIQLFQTWFYEVEKSGGVDEANAMTISNPPSTINYLAFMPFVYLPEFRLLKV